MGITLRDTAMPCMGLSLSPFNKGLPYSCADESQSKNRLHVFYISNLQTLLEVFSSHDPLISPTDAHSSWPFTKDEIEAQRNFQDSPEPHNDQAGELGFIPKCIFSKGPFCSRPWSNDFQLSVCYLTGSCSLHMASFHCFHICWKMLEEANPILKKWAYGSQFTSRALSEPCQ